MKKGPTYFVSHYVKINSWKSKSPIGSSPMGMETQEHNFKQYNLSKPDRPIKAASFCGGLGMMPKQNLNSQQFKPKLLQSQGMIYIYIYIGAI